MADEQSPAPSEQAALPSVEVLIAERAQLVEQLTQARSRIEDYEKLVRLLQEANERLKRGLLGQKAERFVPSDSQLSLAVLEMVLGTSAEASAAAETDAEAAVETGEGAKSPSAAAKLKVEGHERSKPVRKPFAAELPRVAIEILPEEVRREGLDAFERIGEESREVIERRSASCVVVEINYPKFVRKGAKAAADGAPTASETQPGPAAETSSSAETLPPAALPADALDPAAVEDDQTRAAADEACPPVAVRSTPRWISKVLQASALELPIVRGTAGPALLAETIVRRWADHQPLSRQEGIFAREGLSLSKSTMCSWHQTLGELVSPLVEAMFADAYSSPYLCVDATGVLVQAKEQCKLGHFWVLVAPEKHVLYRFSAKHDGAAVDALLQGYRGYLVADAHAVYDHLYKSGDLVEVACWAHCRRYFFKSIESDPLRAKHALASIAALFKLERSFADAPKKKRLKVRDQRSRPIVEAFFAWCLAQRDLVLDGSPIAAALRYALNQAHALRRFLDDAALPMSNNISELHLRREVLGRRNWLFVGSEDGAITNTLFVSLLASCRLHNIEPLAYLRDLFILLPNWPSHRVLQLAPAYWKQTLEQPDTQRLLENNVFRRVSLGLPVVH